MRADSLSFLRLPPSTAPAARLTALAAAAPPGDATPSSEGCGHIDQSLCESQSLPLFTTACVYVVTCVALVSVWRIRWNKRGTGAAWKRFIVPLIVGMAAAGVLVTLDPAGSTDLKCCLADATYRSAVFQGSAAGRALLLGALPAGALYFIVTALLGSLKR